MQRITPFVGYANVSAAIDWLSRAFGFAEVLRYAEENGQVSHAEITLGEDANVMLGGPGGDFRDPVGDPMPAFFVLCQVDDVDAHFQRAVSAGAQVIKEPVDEPYGIRMYRCLDPFGHRWDFFTPVKDIAPEEWGAVRA